MTLPIQLQLNNPNPTKPNMMMTPTVISIPQPATKMEYTIDKDELFYLRDRKFLTTWQYVGLAIKLSYAQYNPSIDIGSFCESWGVTELEFHEAIVTLTKKGALAPSVKQLSLDLFFTQDQNGEE